MESEATENEQDGVLKGLEPQTMRSVIAVEPHCPKCTGPMVQCRVGSVGIYGWWLERISRGTGALGPSHVPKSEVTAHVCTRCGYVEFYAKDPSALSGTGNYQ